MKLGRVTLPEPFEWQQREDRMFGDAAKRGIFASPRLGKTNAVALSLRRRAQDGMWACGLVTAPLKVCPTWMEVLDAAGIPTHPLYDYSAAKIARLYAEGDWEGLAVVNRDKLIHVSGIVNNLDAFIADESHNYAAVSSDRAKAYRKLARTTRYVRALTGTPVPRHYGSLWSQLAPLDPDRWPSSYERFAQRFLVRDAMFKSRVLSHINTDELQAMVLAVASIYRREDIFGPDRYQIVQRFVDMPDRAWKLYHTLAKEWIIEDPAFKQDIVAANAGVRLMRLQQLTSGFVPGGEDGLPTPIHQAKIDAMLADLDEVVQSEEKAVVMHRFVHEGQVAHDEIARLFPSVPLFKIDGQRKRTADEDKAVMEAFNNAVGAAVIVVQIQSGSEGISLRKGSHLMYLSRTFAFTDDEQSRDRIYDHDEAGALPRTVTYYEVDGTVDGFVSNLLLDKRDLHEAVRNADRESLVYGRIRRHARKVA